MKLHFHSICEEHRLKVPFGVKYPPTFASSSALCSKLPGATQLNRWISMIVANVYGVLTLSSGSMRVWPKNDTGVLGLATLHSSTK